MWSKISLAILIGYSVASCSGGDDGKDIIIRSSVEYNELNAKAQKLSMDGLTAFERGEPLSPKESSNLKETLPIYESMIEFVPTNYIPFVMKGKVLRALGRDEDAISAFEQSLNVVPVNATEADKTVLAEAAAEIGRIGIERHDYEAAADAGSAAMDLQPKSPDYPALLARIRIEQYHEDLMKLEKGEKLENNPGQQKDLHLLEAQNYIDQALKLDPQNEEALNLRKLIDLNEKTPAPKIGHAPQR